MTYWQPSTYQDALIAGTVADGERLEAVPTNLGMRVRCACGNEVWPAQITDVRPLSADITGGQAWACDGCVSLWMARPENPLTRATWCEALGAPVDVVARFNAAESA